MTETYDPEKLPDVVDEAGETPRWVPVLGIILFFGVLAAMAFHASGDDAHDRSSEERIHGR